MIENKTSQEKKWIQTILISLFFISLGYVLFEKYKPLKKYFETNKEDKTKDSHEYHKNLNFDYGSISDSIYCNNYFKFQIAIPKGYDGKYKKYDYIEKNIYERDSIPISPRLAKDIENCNLLLIEPHLIKVDWLKSFKETGSIEDFEKYNSKKIKRDFIGTDCQLTIRVHNLYEASLDSYIKQFKNLHNPNYGIPKTKTISGIDFREYHGVESHGGPIQEVHFKLLGGKNKNIISYNTQIHDFAFSIDIFYTTKKQKKHLLKIVENMSFFK
ncbi:hypothetical protein [uncultured Maribacter sp.]|uniref:hypothetical protein n=1 Tax=uncultured Maribacter sp. TaxID=431308 RepID=UPI00261F39B7|nr:hypothetical protein [uncultured Maribacter sp.]